MQALIAPALAAAGGAAPIAYIAQAGTALAGGLASRASAKGDEEQAKINSFIGRTRAIQTDVNAREGLTSEMGSMRAALAANGQRATVGTEEMFRELRRVRGRDRRIEFGNRMQEASGYNMQAKAARQESRIGPLGGFIKAAPSIFDLQGWRTKNRG